MKSHVAKAVVVLAFAVSTLVPAVAAAAPTVRSSSAAPIVPGELLVVFKNDLTPAQAAAFARAHHVSGTYLSTVNIYVVHLPEAQAAAAMARMKADSRVASVERSYVMEAAT